MLSVEFLKIPDITVSGWAMLVFCGLKELLY